MATFTQKYQEAFGEKFPLPLLNLLLTGPAGSVPTSAIVDSGAYRPIFPQKLAELVGIDLSNSWSEVVQYGGSRTTGKIGLARIELIPDGPVLDTSILFVPQLELRYALLGRVGFFDRFKEVAFVQERLSSRLELRR
jgi:hypothetical protein